MAVMTTIDGVFVGHGVGSDALAAVNIFAPFWMIMTGLGLLFGIGCSVISSVHLSQNNEKAARINMTQTLIFGVLITVTLTVLVQSFSTQSAYLLGSSDRLLPYVLDYQKWLAYAFCALFLQSVGLLIIRLDGSPKPRQPPRFRPSSMSCWTMCSCSSLTRGLREWRSPQPSVAGPEALWSCST